MDKPTTSELFWAKVNKTETCWIWTGYIDKYGYGRYKTTYAHRFSFELHAGRVIKEGRQIDHICHQRACVNPKHLRSVTNKQNGENRRGPNKNSTSGIRGVTWNKKEGKWRGDVKHRGIKYSAGTFHDKEEAGKAVAKLRNKLFTCNSLDRIKQNREAA